MLRVIFLSLCCSVVVAVAAEGADSIVGRWQFKNDEMEIAAEFFPDGTFRQVTASSRGRETHVGRFQVSGQILSLLPQGATQPLNITTRFVDADTLSATYPSGESLQWKRLKPAGTGAQPGGPTQPPPPKAEITAKAPAKEPPSAPTGVKRPTILLERTWEPNERAFTFLVPKGWKVEGGMFNVNPLNTNGPGNTMAPKCDLSVKRDERGTVMFRWVPTWNYADLTYSPTGFSFFRPGQHYQGMLVKLLPSVKQFLIELLRTTRPQASGLSIIAEDPAREVAEAYARNAQQNNLQLRQMGLRPNVFESLALLVEYAEGGQRFREGLMTTIADARGGSFAWSNQETVTFRAPAEEFEAWKPVLDLIRSSMQVNPQWLAALTRAIGERAKAALETQRYVNRVANEIVENRRKTHAEIRHENWLFITGQEEYTNPFNGQAELGTYDYRYRWVNNQGSVLYSDENSFDPNNHEEYKTREWKRSPVRQR